MSIIEYLVNNGIRLQTIEGGIYENDLHQQRQDLINIVSNLNPYSSVPIKNTLEIGFNAGTSSVLFLENNENNTVTSFDLGEHNYIYKAQEYITNNYPGRHTLIVGDSRITIPEYIKNNENTKFDFIFIDGGHAYDVAKSDLDNCYKLAHENTIVAIDDYTYTPGYSAGYTEGPTNAWNEFVNSNKIKEINKKEYRIGRGMAWGIYQFT